MDLLFREYASPFSLLDMLIGVGRFNEWIDQFLATHKENIQWDMWLHKVFHLGWQEFINQVEVDQATMNMTDEEIETTVNESYEILNNFIPDDLEGGD